MTPVGFPPAGVENDAVRSLRKGVVPLMVVPLVSMRSVYSQAARGCLKVSRQDAPKRQVDARPARTRFFVDPMPPMVLGVALHQEKTAARKFQVNRLQSLLALVLQYKGPF